eukprot:3970268-Pleurochrysis_carterae.AAC.1
MALQVQIETGARCSSELVWVQVRVWICNEEGASLVLRLTLCNTADGYAFENKSCCMQVWVKKPRCACFFCKLTALLPS